MQNGLHYLLPVLLIGWIIYRRTKRTIGFQKLSRGKLKFRIVMFSIVGLLIFLLGFVHPIHFVGYALGLAAGIGLGLTAIRHTRFEKRTDGWYYRTHIWIEVTVLVLFLGRIAYRFAVIALSGNPAAIDPAAMNPGDPSQLAKDPVTAGIFFVIVSYYVLYFSYLLREEVKLEDRPIETSESSSVEET